MSWYPPAPDPYNGYAGGYYPPPPPAVQYPPHQPPQHHGAAAAAPPYGGHRFDYGPQAAAAAAAAMAATLGGQAPPASIYAASPPPPSVSHHYYGSASPPPAHARAESEGPPPPDVATDPNVFRRYFMNQLASLSFNSKPLITNLTLFAHEHLLRMAPVVASCLEEHLRASPPTFKLPALYLLDSISKNIGPPYLALFARFIERSFLNAYHAVDPPTRIKMEELLGTWRTGAQDGGELFRSPDEGRHGRVQRGIESALFGTGGRGGGLGANGRSLQESESYQSGMQQVPTAASTGERSGVLFDLRRLLQLRVDQSVQNPTDEVNKRQIDALRKLEDLVLNTQLTSDQVNQIRGQLAALAPREPSVDPHAVRASSSQPSSLLAPPSLAALNHLARSLSPPAMGSPPPTAQMYQSMSVPPMSVAGRSRDTTPALGVPPGLVAPAPPAPAPVGGIDLSLLASLQASGGLESLLASVKATPPPPDVKPAPTTDVAVDPLVDEYDRSLIALDLPLSTSSFLKAHVGEAVAFLYDRLRLQCQQCGLRFFDSPIGKRHMDAHLDWHFTHKRRIREGAARTQGRSWFSLEEDWIHSDEVDEERGTEVTQKETKALQEAKLDSEALKRKKVVAPSGGDERRCPICREKFKSEWSDEDEDWVYWNAIKVDGAIYHATCRAEATAATNAARLRAEDAALMSATREATPTVPALKKRKNEEELKQEGDEIPMKKVKNEDEVDT